MTHNHYRRLSVMLLISFGAMYVLMYAMVDVLANVLPNYNQFYMAGLMTAPMALIELLLMGSMYPNKKLNNVIIMSSIAALIIFFLLIRFQSGVADKQFLKSMIPHHASALLMCRNATITDPEIRELCERIISSQQSEIDWMKTKLDQLE